LASETSAAEVFGSWVKDRHLIVFNFRDSKAALVCAVGEKAKDALGADKA
jgi:hypothetical protein